MVPDLCNSQGERLACSFHAGSPERDELFVLGHGVTSDKDRPWSEALAAGLAEQGIAALRIAFSGNGESEGDFADSTILKEVEDLRSVLEAFPDRRVGYIGHSMGGAVGLKASSKLARIQWLVSLAGMVHTAEFAERVFGHLAPGDLMLDKPGCPLSVKLMDEMRSLDTLVELGAQVSVPWLIVHGDADDVVPLVHATDVHGRAGRRPDLRVLPGADHNFSGDDLPRMTSIVVEWILEHVGTDKVD